jgi:hypothetical protein
MSLRHNLYVFIRQPRTDIISQPAHRYAGLEPIMSTADDIVAEATSITEYLAAQRQILSIAALDGVQDGQVKSLGSKISGLPTFDLMGATKLTTAISTGPWTLAQKDFLAIRISERLAVHQTKTTPDKRPLQLMAGVLSNYFTEDDYAFLVSSDHLLHSKITRVCERLHRLGLTCPSEATIRFVVAFLMIKALQNTALSLQSQFSMVSEVKGMLKTSAKKSPKSPFPHLQCFPQSPRELPADLLKFAYPDAQPINVEIPNLDLVAHSVPLRNTNKSIKPDWMHQPQLGQHPSATAMPSMMHQLMNMMAGAMSGPAPTQWSFPSAMPLGMDVSPPLARIALADGSAVARCASLLALNDLAPPEKNKSVMKRPISRFRTC